MPTSRHDKQLLKLLKQLLVDLCERVEHAVICPVMLSLVFFSPALILSNKAHSGTSFPNLCCYTQFFLRFVVRAAAKSFEMPWSCIVTP